MSFSVFSLTTPKSQSSEPLCNSLLGNLVLKTNHSPQINIKFLHLEITFVQQPNGALVCVGVIWFCVCARASSWVSPLVDFFILFCAVPVVLHHIIGHEKITVFTVVKMLVFFSRASFWATLRSTESKSYFWRFSAGTHWICSWSFNVISPEIHFNL